MTQSDDSKGGRPWSPNTMVHGRSWAELIGPTKFRFHHPCGHTSTKDYSKGIVARRMGVAGCKMMASWWSKERGGVVAPCPKCHPKKHGRAPMRWTER